MANTDTLTSFLTTMNKPITSGSASPIVIPPYPITQKVADLLTWFSDDDPSHPGPGKKPNYPCLGITDHGPAFFGKYDIGTFFTQLFNTFSGMQWKLYQVNGNNAPTLSWSGNLGKVQSELGIQMMVVGTYQAPWFATGSGHESNPLSQLDQTYPTGGNLGRTRNDTGGLPAYALFSFDSGNLICQLQIYLDRYALMQSITTQSRSWNPDAPPHGSHIRLQDSQATAPDGSHAISRVQGRRITINIED